MHPLRSPGETSHPFCTPALPLSLGSRGELTPYFGKHSEVVQATTQERTIEYFSFSKEEAELLRDQEPCPRQDDISQAWFFRVPATLLAVLPALQELLPGTLELQGK